MRRAGWSAHAAEHHSLPAQHLRPIPGCLLRRELAAGSAVRDRVRHRSRPISRREPARACSKQLLHVARRRAVARSRRPRDVPAPRPTSCDASLESSASTSRLLRTATREATIPLSIPSDRPVEVPCIRLSADFTGRTLDRSRIRRAPREAKYGGPSAVLTWGGDAVARRRAEVAAPAAAYDDGYPPELWKGKGRAGEPAGTSARDAGASVATTSEPGYEPYEEMGLGEAYGRPTQRPRVASQGNRGPAATPPGEPPGAEDTRGFARAPRTPDSARAAAYGRAEVSTRALLAPVSLLATRTRGPSG